MSLPDEQPEQEEPTPSQDATPAEVRASEELFPEETILPDDFTPLGPTARLPRARRRRAHRKLVMPNADARATILDNLARRAFPSIEFFLFALLCGAILGAAYLLDSPAFLLLGILLAPLLTPWVGLVLAIQTGSWRFFFLTLSGLIVASLLVFLTGALAGWAGRLWLPLPLFYAGIHSHLWWPDLFLVTLGAVLLTISFVQSEKKPILPSIMLVYGLFLPLSAAGVGLGIGTTLIWQHGLRVFLVHLALSLLAGAITLAAMHFKPAKFGGYLLSFLIGVAALLALVYFTGLTDFIRNEIVDTRKVEPTPTITIIPTTTPTLRPTATATRTRTPTATLLPTDTSLPTPAYALITAPAQFGGANVRSEPAGGITLVTLSNGITVELLPDIQNVDGFDWAHIKWGDTIGWVLSSVLTATSASPVPTP